MLLVLSVSQLLKSLRNVARREIRTQKHQQKAELPGSIVKRKIQSNRCRATLNIRRLAASQIPVRVVGVTVCDSLHNLLIVKPAVGYLVVLQSTDSEWREMMVLMWAHRPIVLFSSLIKQPAAAQTEVNCVKWTVNLCWMANRNHIRVGVVLVFDYVLSGAAALLSKLDIASQNYGKP